MANMNNSLGLNPQLLSPSQSGPVLFIYRISPIISRGFLQKKRDREKRGATYIRDATYIRGFLENRRS